MALDPDKLKAAARHGVVENEATPLFRHDVEFWAAKFKEAKDRVDHLAGQLFEAQRNKDEMAAKKMGAEKKLAAHLQLLREDAQRGR